MREQPAANAAPAPEQLCADFGHIYSDHVTLRDKGCLRCGEGVVAYGDIRYGLEVQLEVQDGR